MMSRVFALLFLALAALSTSVHANLGAPTEHHMYLCEQEACPDGCNVCLCDDPSQCLDDWEPNAAYKKETEKITGVDYDHRNLVIGTPVNSWICADCWKPKFCKKNAWWCNENGGGRM